MVKINENPDVERKVLAVAFLNTAKARRLMDIGVKDFNNNTRQKILGKIQEFIENHKLVEMDTLAAAMDYNPDCVVEITNICSHTLTDDFLDDHIEVLKGFRNYRMFERAKLSSDPEQLIEMVADMQKNLYTGRTSILDNDEAIELAANYLKKGDDPVYDPKWVAMSRHLRLQQGIFYVVTGMPSSGKSEFLDALMLGMAQDHGWKTLFFSPENHPVELHLRKFVEKISNKRFFTDDYGQGVSFKEFEGSMDFINKHFQFMDPPLDKRSLDDILSQAESALGKQRFDAMVIDPWNEVDIYNNTHLREDQFISRALTKIKAFAKYYRVAMFIVAHPTKMTKGDDEKYPVPTLYNISGAAHWYNKADVGIVVHRDPFDPDTKFMADIYIQKIRFKQHGERAKFSLHYDFVSGNYSELPQDYMGDFHDKD
jgi:hypothetical protein